MNLSSTLVMQMKGLTSIIALAVVAAALALITRDAEGVAHLAEDAALIGNIISIAATLLGFLLALVAIMVTLSDRKLILNMTKTGHLWGMYNRYFISAAALFSSIVVAMVAQTFALLDHSGTVWLIFFFFYFGLLSTVYGTWHFYIVVSAISQTAKQRKKVSTRS